MVELDPLEVLVVAPHADDEAVGCGGTIAKLIRRGASVHVVVAGMGGVRTETETIEMRMAELHAASEVLGVQRYTVLYQGLDMRLDTIPRVEIVTRLDALLEEGYDYVFYPCPSHNHDHQVVHLACTAALRPWARASVPKIALMYENSYPGWAPATSTRGKLYVDTTSTFDVKQRAVRSYVSQVKPYPHPLSARAVELLSSIRGLEIGSQYAELFYVTQIIGLPGRSI